jgi:hypothetical protein
VIGGLAPGVHNVRLIASGRGRRIIARVVEGVRVKAGDDARADLMLIEGRRLHGTVTDFPDEKPMSDISVGCRIAAFAGSGGDSTLTDERGRYELFVPPGAEYLYVTMPGPLTRAHHKHLTVFADGDPDPIDFQKAHELTADFREISLLPIEFEARIRVRSEEGDVLPRKDRDLAGRIFDEHGSPIAGMKVTSNERRLVSGATDRMGLFRLEGLPPGPFRLGVDKDGYKSGWAMIPPEAHEVELTVPSGPCAAE